MVGSLAKVIRPKFELAIKMHVVLLLIVNGGSSVIGVHVQSHATVDPK